MAQQTTTTTNMSLPISKGVSLEIDGEQYSTIQFTEHIDTELFQQIVASMRKHGCVFSKEKRTWFCPRRTYFEMMREVKPLLEKYHDSKAARLSEALDRLMGQNKKGDKR